MYEMVGVSGLSDVYINKYKIDFFFLFWQMCMGFGCATAVRSPCVTVSYRCGIHLKTARSAVGEVDGSIYRQ